MMADILEGNTKQSKTDYDIVIRETKPRFLHVVSEETFAREASFAMQAILHGNAAEALQKCSKQSIQDAVVNIAMTGATLNPALQQAYLIPRKGKCCLDFSYRGLIKLAVDSGSVLDIDSTVVHEKDVFEYEMGLTPKLGHVPSNEDEPGPMRFVYAIAILLSGIKKFIVLNRAEVDKIRASSQMPNGLMWKDFFDEACRKTAVKKLYKMLPQTDKLSNAVWVVNQHEGLDFERLKEESSNAQKIYEKFNPPQAVIEAEGEEGK